MLTSIVIRIRDVVDLNVDIDENEWEVLFVALNTITKV
jgi:hypothetical protein